MFPNADTVAMAGAAPCRHCAGTLHQSFFDATGRVEAPRFLNVNDANGKRRERSGDTHSVPLFPAYTVADARDGLTAPPAVVCPHCDAPDPDLDLSTIDRHLDFLWDVETWEPTDPNQPESD